MFHLLREYEIIGILSGLFGILRVSNGRGILSINIKDEIDGSGNDCRVFLHRL